MGPNLIVWGGVILIVGTTLQIARVEKWLSIPLLVIFSRELTLNSNVRVE